MSLEWLQPLQDDVGTERHELPQDPTPPSLLDLASIDLPDVVRWSCETVLGAEFQLWQSMFRIEFTPEAVADLRSFRRYDQERIVGGIEGHLPHHANESSRNRKRPRPNQLAEWELRIGEFRVFHDVDLRESLVKIEAIGYKIGSTQFVHGEEYEL